MLCRPGRRLGLQPDDDVPRHVGQVGNPMPLVFCPAISAGSVGRSSRSTESPVFAWSLASISVPRFLQVSGRGKNERHWVGNLRRVGQRAEPVGRKRVAHGPRPWVAGGHVGQPRDGAEEGSGAGALPSPPRGGGGPPPPSGG